MQRHIINIYTKDVAPKLIATLDVSSKFNVARWLRLNTDYELKDIKGYNLYTYNDSIIDSEKVYEILDILNIEKW